jgi:hypothetical protein
LESYPKVIQNDSTHNPNCSANQRNQRLTLYFLKSLLNQKTAARFDISNVCRVWKCNTTRNGARYDYRALGPSAMEPDAPKQPRRDDVQISHANDVFLVPHPGFRQSHFDVGLALGYPIREPGLRHVGTVYYVNPLETLELGRATGAEVGQVAVFEHTAPSDAQEKDGDMINIHHMIAEQIAQSVGRSIAINHGNYTRARNLMVRIESGFEPSPQPFQ